MADIILRVRHEKGFSRVTITTKDTMRVLKDKICTLVGCTTPTDISIFFDKTMNYASQLMVSDTTVLSLNPKIKNGVELFVKQRQSMQMEKQPSTGATHLQAPTAPQNQLSSNCNHAVSQRCINCISFTAQPKETDPKVVVNRCTHPPGGSCLNCLDTDKKDEKKEKKE